MHRIDDVKYALLPIGLVVIALVGLILLEPDFGTAMSLMLIEDVPPTVPAGQVAIRVINAAAAYGSMNVYSSLSPDTTAAYEIDETPDQGHNGRHLRVLLHPSDRCLIRSGEDVRRLHEQPCELPR